MSGDRDVTASAAGRTVLLQSLVRSGTTYLGSLLAANPRIGVTGELLYPGLQDGGWWSFLRNHLHANPAGLIPDHQPPIFLEYLTSLEQAMEGRQLLIDIKLEQLSFSPALHDVFYQPGLRFAFILLRRANLLKLVLSDMLMHRRLERGDGVVHRDYVPEPELLVVVPREVMWWVRFKADLVNGFAARARSSGAPCFDISYEDLLNERERTRQLDRLQAWMGVTPVELTGSLVKQNPYPIRDIVANYDELADAFRKSEFAYCLSLPS